jgi:hypothetical protein
MLPRSSIFLALGALALIGCHDGNQRSEAPSQAARSAEDPDQLASFAQDVKEFDAEHRDLRSKAGLPELPDGAPIVRILSTAGLARYRASTTAARRAGVWTVEFVDEAWNYKTNNAQPVKFARASLSTAMGRKLDDELAANDLYQQPHTKQPGCVDGGNVFLEVLRAPRTFQAYRICEADGAIARVDSILSSARPGATPTIVPDDAESAQPVGSSPK